MDISLNQVTILVADMERSVRFYRDQLGLTALEVFDHWSEFQAGAVNIAMHPGRTRTRLALENGTDAGTVNIVLHVPDLVEGMRTLRDRGIEVNGPLEMEGLPQLATFGDPDGVSFTLAQGDGS